MGVSINSIQNLGNINDDKKAVVQQSMISTQSKDDNVKVVTQSGAISSVAEAKATVENSKTSAVKQRQEAQNKIDAANKERLEKIKDLDKKEEVDEKKLDDSINTLNNIKNLGLSFVIDKENDVTLVNVIDKNTNETVRQIPSDEFLRISRSLTKYRDSLDEVAAKLSNNNEKDGKELKGIILDSKI